MTRSETTGSDGRVQKYSYYFINYRSFVNVVKYKLDKMRERIENEEKMAKHRQFYHCPRCESEFGDLDVIHLFDPMDGNLKCSHCKEILVEDESRSNPINAASTVSRLNEMTRPIIELIRQTENMRLAPEVLEPEPTTIEHLESSLNHGQRSCTFFHVSNLHFRRNAIQILIYLRPSLFQDRNHGQKHEHQD
jgi:transcription initiation factor TFIIE subunit alpha